MFAGLGSVFGENLLQGLHPGDKQRELKVADVLLMQHFDTFFSGVSDFDQLPDRIQALAAALATVVKVRWKTSYQLEVQEGDIWTMVHLSSR